MADVEEAVVTRIEKVGFKLVAATYKAAVEVMARLHCLNYQ